MEAVIQRKSIFQSLVFKMGSILLALVTLALTTLLSSYFVIEDAAKDAEAVNLAGSLRMTSYQLLATRLSASEATADYNGKINRLIKQFEDRIHRTSVIMDVEKGRHVEFASRYRQVLEHWQTSIKPLFNDGVLTNSTQIALTSAVDDFVNEVDGLVKQYQRKAESRIERLRFIQLSAMFLTLLLVAGSLIILHQRVEMPLRKLTDAARRIGKGDFSQPVEIDNQDELDVLAQTINQMAADLSELYGSLEARVAKKTKALATSANSLNFLYHIARDVSEHHREAIDFDFWVKELSRVTGIEGMELCLKTPEAVIPYIHLRGDEKATLDESCHAEACVECINQKSMTAETAESNHLHYPIIKEGIRYGILAVHLPTCDKALDWQHQLLQSFTDQVAIALSIQNQVDQNRREALMNERSVIARELHDSLAQALSYLKIQVTRLKRSLDKDNIATPELDNITGELQEGLGAAYRQLRELLTTFRLTISEKGLKAALGHTVEQFREQHPLFTISFDCEIDRIPLTPNEEIHMLQLTREALQNALRHSGGKHAEVRLTETSDNRITVSVIDDGKGLPDTPGRLNHYGLAIMNERARNLGGHLELLNRAEGGTEVRFVFNPSSLASQS